MTKATETNGCGDIFNLGMDVFNCFAVTIYLYSRAFVNTKVIDRKSELNNLSTY